MISVKRKITLLSLISILLVTGIQCDRESDAKVDAVYFAQKHVLEPENKYFKLFSDLEALIKIHIISATESAAPPVIARIKLNGNSLELPLSGPEVLPMEISNGPGVVQHNFEDSFTGVIPADWVQPGLSLDIFIGDDVKYSDTINIGASSKIIMTMFDVHYFEYSPGDYPDGWKTELEAKWPTSELELRRIPKVIFPELIVPPRRNVNAKAVRVKSKEDYKLKTGLKFDGEQAAALAWKSALKDAAGINGRFSLYYVNIYGANAGGQAWDFGGVGNGTSPGVLIHELGHAFLLPHWANDQNYPYRGDTFGIKAPDNVQEIHAGPSWAFDLVNKKFIPPTVQANFVKSKRKKPIIVGTYKMDPMQGGGTGDQEEGYIFRHFSDYSIYKAQSYLEDHIVIWDESKKSYVSWNDETGSYSKMVSNNGVEYPIERDVDVISVMAATSPVTPQATLVYPPIGPYSSGIIKTFDPDVEADRKEAAEIYCEDGGCDLSLRVTQGGKVSVYMLRESMNPEEDVLELSSLKTQAVNLRASGGIVSKIELLDTPDAEINGLPKQPAVISAWSK